MAKKEVTIPNGWNKSESCSDDLTKLAVKYFGATKVNEWRDELETHFEARRDYTGYEAYLNAHYTDVSLKVKLFLEEIVARCLFMAAREQIIDDDERDDDGNKIAPEWGAEHLKGYTFHHAELEMRPNGSATVKYMGETTKPKVPGMIGINCEVHLDGEPHIRPTVLFVSKPFHQYRAVNVM
jgi:hypothetical protein